MREERSAGAVIFRRTGGGGEGGMLFLLLNYPSGHWDFVKGKMEYGETRLQTASRETAEETGIMDLAFADGFEEYVEYEFQHRGEPVHKRVVFFLAETSTADVTLSHEHVGYAWMSLKEASERVTFDNARRVLAGAADHLRAAS